MYIAYLSLTPYYIIKSEKELNKGFADILIKPFNPYVKYIGLLEFKYIKREEKLTKEKQKQLIHEAKEQLNRYEKDILVQEYVKQGLTLKKVVLVFHGWELVECVSV
jgi:DNA-directed RNA polymerase specialized sigma subunit